MKLFIGTGLAAGLCGTGGPQGPAARLPALQRAPELRGQGLIGAELAVDPGAWTGAAEFVFAWLRDGAPMQGAAGPVYVPAAADDRAALACRVTAVNAAGRTACDTPAITIVFPAPLLVGAAPDFHYTQSTGPHIVDVSPFFTGSSLSFSITGDGVAIDSSTGLVTIAATSLLSGVAVVVTAANSGGRAELGFSLRVTPAAPAAKQPVLIAAPTLAGTGRVGEELTVDPGVWGGEPAPDLTLQWLRDGAPVAGATQMRFTPGDAEDAASVACRVTARNAAGIAVAETGAILVTRTAPVATGALADLVFAQALGAQDAPTAGAFLGAALRFAVAGAEAGIDPETGVVTIPTGARRAAEVVTVTATNSGGAATQSFAVRVLAAPVAVGTPGAVSFARGAGASTAPTQAFFGGDDLVYALETAPAGVTINPGTGLLTIPTGAAMAATLTVRAANAVGAATQSFAVRVLAAPVAVGTPAGIAFARGAGAATAPTQAFFGGDDLVYALETAPAGVTINPGTGLVTIPTAAALEATLVVRAANIAGSATQSFAVRVLAAPVTVGTPAAVSFVPGPGAATVSAQAFFGGDDLVYALETAPAGVTINPGTGLVTIPTAAALEATLVVRAANAVGAATQSFAVRVRARVTVFDAAGKLAEVSYLHTTAAPAWTYEAEGYARLIPNGPNDRAHGAWILGQGDGRYRVLLRPTHPAAAPTQARPFGINGRMSRTGLNWRGLRVDLDLKTSGARAIEIRQYTGSTFGSTLLGAGAVAWAWNVWCWMEAEFDGAIVRARLYPENDPAPAWQATATTSYLGDGFFGPAAHTLGNAFIPQVHVKRCEYSPLNPFTPLAAPVGADWSLDQITVQK